MKAFNVLLSVCCHYLKPVYIMYMILKYFVLDVNEMFHATFFI